MLETPFQRIAKEKGITDTKEMKVPERVGVMLSDKAKERAGELQGVKTVEGKQAITGVQEPTLNTPARDVFSDYTDFKTGIDPVTTISSTTPETTPQERFLDFGFEEEVDFGFKEVEPSFIGGIQQDLERRGERIAESIMLSEQGKQTKAETALQMGGEFAGGLLDVGGAVFEKLTPSPENMQKLSEFFDLKRFIPQGSGIKEGIEQGQQGFDILSTQGVEAYNKFVEENPRFKRNADAIANLAFISPIFRGFRATEAPLARTLERVGEKGIQVEREQFVRQLIRPVQTKTVKEAQVSRTTETGRGLFKRSEIAPTAKELAAEKEVLKISGVKKGNTVQQNFNVVQNENKLEAKFLEKQLESNDFIYPKKELLSEFNKGKQRLGENPLIVGDSAQTAEKLVNKFMQIIEESKAKGSELLKARKKYDRWLESQKGTNVFDPKNENALTIANREIRNIANDFMHKKAKNIDVKASLKKQSNLYTAMDNLVPKAAMEADTRLGRIMQSIDKFLGTRNRVYQAIGAGLGIGIFGVAQSLATPFLIGFGTIGGGYKLGKFLTSPKMKIQFSKALKQIEAIKPKNTTEMIELIEVKKNINDLINQ